MANPRPKGFPPIFKLVGSKPGIDKEILAVIRALNLAGYRTFSSCAGHSSHQRGNITIDQTPDGYETGFNGRGGINSLRKSDVQKIIPILKKHGLKNIRFERPGDLTFTAVGRRNKQ